jgi:NADPH:quinone reductase-like Zn-dependent oxidoreductase
MEFGLDKAIATDTVDDFSQQVHENTNGNGADVILDLVGAKYFAQNLRSLAMKGRMMLVGLTSGSTADFDMSVALYKRARIIGTVLRPRSVEEKADAVHRFADEVLPLFSGGKLKPTVDKIFSCEEAALAYRRLASNETFGKVLITF